MGGERDSQPVTWPVAQALVRFERDQTVAPFGPQ